MKGNVTDFIVAQARTTLIYISHLYVYTVTKRFWALAPVRNPR